ncbi:MAG: hypothetical protein IKR50_02375 [Prevotella sp.]|nr:hypothetical protein [Prevotella sp.]
MANSKIAMQYDLRQNNLRQSPSYMKWYPRAVRRATLNTKGLANHIVSHGSVYTRDVVEGMVAKFRDCIVELLSQGVGVKLDGLGTFYPSIEADGSDSPENYNVNDHLTGVHIRFLPEKVKDEQLTSQAFAKRVHLQQRFVIDSHGVPQLPVNDCQDEMMPDSSSNVEATAM